MFQLTYFRTLFIINPPVFVCVCVCVCVCVYVYVCVVLKQTISPPPIPTEETHKIQDNYEGEL